MGQISSPAGSSWKIQSIDRELSPGSNTGAGQVGNRVIMFGENTGTNTVASDMVLMGADVMGNGLQADSTLAGAVVIGSQACATMKVGNTIAGFDAANPITIIGYGAFNGYQPSNGNPLNTGVAIGANIMQAANVTAGIGFFQAIAIGNNIGLVSRPGGQNGLSQAVVIGFQSCNLLQSVTSSVLIGWKTDNDGGTLVSNVNNTVCIGAGNRPSGSIVIGNVNDSHTLIGAGIVLSAAPVSANVVIANSPSAISGSYNVFIGNGPGGSPIPLGSLASGNSGLLIGSNGQALISGGIAGGNIQFGLTTGNGNRDYGSGTGAATNNLKLLNGTVFQFGPSAGGVFFVSAGSLAWLDQNSKRTTLTGPLVADGTYVKNVPTTGFTLAMTASVLQLVPAGTLASGTVTLPVVTSANDGCVVEISSTQTITALTISPDAGHSVVGAPATIAANTGVSFRFNAIDAAWYRRY